MQYQKVILWTTEIGYMGFWVTRAGIRPIHKKVESIVNMKLSKNQKQVCSFIDLVDYYRDMWEKRSHLLRPLTALTSKKVKLKWTFVEQKTFNEIKLIVTRGTLLIYMDFNKLFDIHMYSDFFHPKTSTFSTRALI